MHQEQPSVTGWALDNNTVMLFTQDPSDAAAVEAAWTTFASLTIPGDWPREGVEWATVEPTASASASAASR